MLQWIRSYTNMPATLEKVIDDHYDKRRLDITYVTPNGGKTAIDISTINNLASSYSRETLIGKLAQKREEEKIAKYEKALAAKQTKFLPFILEFYGGFGRCALEATKGFKKMARAKLNHDANKVVKKKRSIHPQKKLCIRPHPEHYGQHHKINNNNGTRTADPCVLGS